MTNIVEKIGHTRKRLHVYKCRTSKATNLNLPRITNADIVATNGSLNFTLTKMCQTGRKTLNTLSFWGVRSSPGLSLELLSGDVLGAHLLGCDHKCKSHQMLDVTRTLSLQLHSRTSRVRPTPASRRYLSVYSRSVLRILLFCGSSDTAVMCSPCSVLRVHVICTCGSSVKCFMFLI